MAEDRKKVMKYPVFIDEKGKEHPCIGFAVDYLRSGWEWFAFDNAGNGNYFGFVCGIENEFGYFSTKELAENNINFTTDCATLHEISPPFGWTKKD